MKLNKMVLKLSNLVISMGNRAEKFKFTKLIKMYGSKECPKCEQELPAFTDYFYNNKNTKSGLQTYCKKCQHKTNKIGRKNRQLNAKANAEKLMKVRK